MKEVIPDHTLGIIKCSSQFSLDSGHILLFDIRIEILNILCDYHDWFKQIDESYHDWSN